MKIKIEDIMIPEERARATYSEEQYQLLEASLKSYGQLEDIKVRPLENGKWELVDGESRLKQMQEAGFEEVEARPLDLNDKDANMVNILMNIARGDQDPMGICLAFTKAKKSGMTEKEMADATGHSIEWVKFMLMLADLPDIYQEALRRGDLLVTHIRHATRLPNPKEVDACLGAAINFKWNTQVTRRYVENRLAEYASAERIRKQHGIEAPPPAIDPQRLSRNVQCLMCGQMVDKEDVSMPRICNNCYTMGKYVVAQIGSGDPAMQHLFKALQTFEAYKTQQQRFFVEKQIQEAPIPREAPPVQEIQDRPENLEMMVKPEGMSAEAWGKMKADLKKHYGG